MQVAPEHPSARMPPRPQHAGGRPASARPPQEQPRRDQHQRPARRQLDHGIAPRPERQRTVHHVGEPDQRMGIDIAAQHPRGSRIDHHLPRFAGCGVDPHLRGPVGGVGQVDPRRHARHRCDRRRDHPRRRDRHRDRRDDLQPGHQRVVQFVPEQIGRAGDAQDQQERRDDQTGIEMPAPDDAIEARIAHRRPPGAEPTRTDRAHGASRPASSSLSGTWIPCGIRSSGMPGVMPVTMMVASRRSPRRPRRSVHGRTAHGRAWPSTRPETSSCKLPLMIATQPCARSGPAGMRWAAACRHAVRPAGHARHDAVPCPPCPACRPSPAVP